MTRSALGSLVLQLSIILALCAAPAAAEENAERNWHFSASLLFSSRGLDGTIIDLVGTVSEVSADVTLEGPFLGITVTY